MVNIHHREPLAPAADEAAMEMFRRQWGIYQKFVQNNYMSAAQGYDHLHRILQNEMARPFRILDLACGDARGMVGALKGTGVIHYHGVDLAQPALDMAKESVKALDCEVELEQADFIQAVHDRREPADVVWIGFSLHHLKTPDKATLMREVRDMIDANGLFLIFEPARKDGESRDEFLSRFERTGRAAWPVFTPDEWQAVLDHVRGFDLPETASGWLELGRGAGFTRAEPVFTDHLDLFRMYCYGP